MLVKSPISIEERCPRRLSLLSAVCLLSLAIVGAGIGLRAVAAPAPNDDKKDEVKKDKDITKDNKDVTKPKDMDDKAADKKEPDKKPRPRQPDPFPDIEDLMKRLPANLPEDQAKMIRQQMEQMRKLMEQMRKQMPDGAFPDLPKLPDGVKPAFPEFPQLPNQRFNPFGRQQEPRLGVRLDRPSDTLVDQLDLPKGQGLIVEEVIGDSAAAKAGLKKHDILLELDGKAVPNNVQAFARMLKDIKPDAKVDAVVLRKTRKETVKGLTLPKAKEVPGNFNFPNVPFNPPNGPGNGLGNFGLGGVTTLKRTNDSFTIRNKQGDLTIEVTGKVEDGKAKAEEIKVTEGDKTNTYTSIDKVPEKHRDQVNRLVEAAGKNRIRFQFRTPRREEF